jgi:hypothetical protein
MKKFFNIIRSQEWWEYKLPPLLAIGYATTLMSPLPLYKTALWLFFLLSALVIGAVYVSVINDITDLDEDLASGKANRIQAIPAKFRWLIPALCILAGLVFGYFIYPDTLSCLLYLLSWIVFSLYSINPVRLKNRGIWGVIADACGSHLFTSLLITASVSYATHQTINWLWFTAIGVWAFCYGLRGILWHQFADRENDIKVNLNTYASKINPGSFKSRSILIIITELIAVVFILIQLNQLLAFIALGMYFILLLIRFRKFGYQLILIISPAANKPFQIFMADYYQVFFPLSLLLTAVFTDSLNIIILIAHICLFPYKLKYVCLDYLRFAKSILKKQV